MGGGLELERVEKKRKMKKKDRAKRSTDYDWGRNKGD
jgi:hypothetical protein